MGSDREMGKGNGGNPAEPACPRCGTTDRDRRILAAVKALVEATFGNPRTSDKPQGRINSVPWQALQVLRDHGGDMTIAEVATEVEARYGRGDRKTPVRGSVGSVLPMLADEPRRQVVRVRKGVYRAIPEDLPLIQGDGDADATGG